MSIPKLEFPPFHLPPEAEALRGEVRAFLKETLPEHQDARIASRAGTRALAEFSKALGKRAGSASPGPSSTAAASAASSTATSSPRSCWATARRPARIGWPTASPARCCCASAARSSARRSCRASPRGECYFSIGMSEPDSGSDLASVRTRAEPVPGGFRVNGTKVWTSGAHRNHYCITLVRTSGQHGDRHKGLSQLLVDLKTPGITIRPIINLAGRHDWNEVTFSDCFIPEELPDRQRGRRLAAGHQRARLRAQRSRALHAELLRAARTGARARPPAGQAGRGHPRPHRRPAVDAAPDVGRGRRHDAGRQVAGHRGGAGEGSRHDLPAGPAGDRPRAGRVATPRPRTTWPISSTSPSTPR